MANRHKPDWHMVTPLMREEIVERMAGQPMPVASLMRRADHNSIAVPPDIHAKLKSYCAKSGVSMSAYVEDLIFAELR